MLQRETLERLRGYKDVRVLRKAPGLYDCGTWTARQGAVVLVSQDKAIQLLTDFPNDWEIAEGWDPPANPPPLPSIGAKAPAPVPAPLAKAPGEVKPRNSTLDYMVDLVMINYNGKAVIERAIRSIYANTSAKFTLTVVDNHSTDGSSIIARDLLRELDPQARSWRVLCQKLNKGYAVACNAGAKAIRNKLIKKGKVLVFLNNDIEVKRQDPDWLERLVKPLEDPKAGITGAMMYNGKGERMPIQRDNWVCGAVIAIRRELFEKLKGFDEYYFFYWEETDLCERVDREGLTIRETGAEVVHYYEPKGDVSFVDHFERGRRYFNKKFGYPPTRR